MPNTNHCIHIRRSTTIQGLSTLAGKTDSGCTSRDRLTGGNFLATMMQRCLSFRFGEEEYNIIPTTYILPDEREELLEYIRADPKNHVIMKPV